MKRRVVRVGPSAVLLDVAPERVPAWYAWLLARRDAGEFAALDVVPAARTVLLDRVDEPERLVRLLRGCPPPPDVDEHTGGLVTVPTVYDGEDLDDVAERWGMSREAAVRRHTGIEFRAAFCGFAPGFAYLTGLPAELHVPRRDEPRTRVPAGSVALAGEYAAVYPAASPGGWRLIGRTSLTLFDLDGTPPATLTPGTRVRFAAVSS
ncbi:allophanate hydrolase [Virgisporangium aliadipatigenens]|uniref:Allophanate hydrolase n=1 Tax=Virgisporangium aliadipatigenens TaxID=741659 RepID=A0A8J3YL51_9ACTN|nr:allophanate hydrolase subunit 1 [Virgisporangium aliadipatigenens]GIJ46312.1 allophanate hydrolase [Virgisporangium aliadipatigenens]